MKIPAEVLSEENYTGTRRIQVYSAMITKYKKEIDVIQKKANPFLKKMEELAKVLDPFYAAIAEHTKEINKIKGDMAPTLELYNKEMAEVELLDQKAQMIKNKLQPIVDKEIEGKLAEFEKPMNITTEKGIHYVEVADKLEEFIKANRKK